MTDFCREMEHLGKAIGNVNRSRVLEALLTGPKTVGEVVRAVKLSQPLVSQNLKLLKSAGIVRDERRGREVYYTVDGNFITDILQRLIQSMSKCVPAYGATRTRRAR